MPFHRARQAAPELDREHELRRSSLPVTFADEPCRVAESDLAALKTPPARSGENSATRGDRKPGTGDRGHRTSRGDQRERIGPAGSKLAPPCVRPFAGHEHGPIDPGPSRPPGGHEGDRNAADVPPPIGPRVDLPGEAPSQDRETGMVRQTRLIRIVPSDISINVNRILICHPPKCDTVDRAGLGLGSETINRRPGIEGPSSGPPSSV